MVVLAEKVPRKIGYKALKVLQRSSDYATLFLRSATALPLPRRRGLKRPHRPQSQNPRSHCTTIAPSKRTETISVFIINTGTHLLQHNCPVVRE
jgi:hypothetical protein